MPSENESKPIEALIDQFSLLSNIPDIEKQVACQAFKFAWPKLATEIFNNKKGGRADNNDDVLALLNGNEIRIAAYNLVKEFFQQNPSYNIDPIKILKHVNDILDALSHLVEFMSHVEAAIRKSGIFEEKGAKQVELNADKLQGTLVEMLSPADEAQFSRLRQSMSMTKLQEVIGILDLLIKETTNPDQVRTKLEYDVTALKATLLTGIECRDKQNPQARSNVYAEVTARLDQHAFTHTATPDVLASELLLACNDFLKDYDLELKKKSKDTPPGKVDKMQSKEEPDPQFLAVIQLMNTLDYSKPAAQRIRDFQACFVENQKLFQSEPPKSRLGKWAASVMKALGKQKRKEQFLLRVSPAIRMFKPAAPEDSKESANDNNDNTNQSLLSRFINKS